MSTPTHTHVLCMKIRFTTHSLQSEILLSTYMYRRLLKKGQKCYIVPFLICCWTFPSSTLHTFKIRPVASRHPSVNALSMSALMSGALSALTTCLLDGGLLDISDQAAHALIKGRFLGSDDGWALILLDGWEWRNIYLAAGIEDIWWSGF